MTPEERERYQAFLMRADMVKGLKGKGAIGQFCLCTLLPFCPPALLPSNPLALLPFCHLASSEKAAFIKLCKIIKYIFPAESCRDSQLFFNTQQLVIFADSICSTE